MWIFLTFTTIICKHWLQSNKTYIGRKIFDINDKFHIVIKQFIIYFDMINWPLNNIIRTHLFVSITNQLCCVQIIFVYTSWTWISVSVIEYRCCCCCYYYFLFVSSFTHYIIYLSNYITKRFNQQKCGKKEQQKRNNKILTLMDKHIMVVCNSAAHKLHCIPNLKL